MDLEFDNHPLALDAIAGGSFVPSEKNRMLTVGSCERLTWVLIIESEGLILLCLWRNLPVGGEAIDLDCPAQSRALLPSSGNTVLHADALMTPPLCRKMVPAGGGLAVERLSHRDRWPAVLRLLPFRLLLFLPSQLLLSLQSQDTTSETSSVSPSHCIHTHILLRVGFNARYSIIYMLDQSSQLPVFQSHPSLACSQLLS